MKIAVLQASSQKEKNPLLVECVKKAVAEKGHEVVNLGVFPGEEQTVSYVETALCISLLLESGSVDFVVTGCSSGQGMMLACNSLPGILCGYVANPSDAYLFGRINGGNAVAYPLGLNFGWAAEINLQSTLDKLFEEPFEIGYPKEDAERKKQDTKLLKEIDGLTKKPLLELLPLLDEKLVQAAFARKPVLNYIIENSKSEAWRAICKTKRDSPENRA